MKLDEDGLPHWSVDIPLSQRYALLRGAFDRQKLEIRELEFNLEMAGHRQKALDKITGYILGL